MADNATRSILVTGAAGFIGFHLCKRLLDEGCFHIVGLDNMDDYYDVGLKEHRLHKLRLCDTENRFEFVLGDIANAELVMSLFERYDFDVVVHMAAQAGVRHSLENPQAYISSNLVGFFNVLEACRRHPVKHLLFASSSSVYGDSSPTPYVETAASDYPISLYAATKKSDELMAHAYSKLFDIPTTGLRFFSVYGPWGRPDMAYYKFAHSMVAGETIPLYNAGDMWRDFSYIDDVIEGVRRSMDCLPSECPSGAPYAIYNLGGSKPVYLLDFVKALEDALTSEGLLCAPVRYEMLPMQPGDVYRTEADTRAIERVLGFVPQTDLAHGLREFAKWYRSYHRP